MLDKPTVFVIGAGAGFDIGMPLGDDLADLIASGVSFYYEQGNLTKGNGYIADGLQRMAQHQKTSWNRSCSLEG